MQSDYEKVTALIVKLKEEEEEKNIERYLQLLNEFVKITIDLCNYFYENNELLPILQFYREISLGYKKALEIIEKNSLESSSNAITAAENNDGDKISLSIKKSYEYWKNNEQIMQKELMKSNINEGNLLLLEGKYEHASFKFKNALEIEKNNIDVLNKLGIAYFHLHLFDEALKCFENAIQFDENNILLLYNIGLVYDILWNNSRNLNNNLYKISAIIFYERALSVNPNHFESLMSLGLLFYKMEDYNNAKLKLDEAMKIHNSDWRLLLAYGCILSDGFHEYEQARNYFDKSIKLNPNSILAKMNLSQILILLNNYSESEKYLNEILKKLEGVEDRSTSLILRILLICTQCLSQQKISQVYVDDLIEFSELKNLELVNWNFNNLIKHVNDSNKIDGKFKKLLFLILSIPKIAESDKEQILVQIRKLSNQQHQQMVTEKIKIISKSEPDLESVGWYYWELSVKAVSEIFESIVSVEYILDPTYKESNKIIDTKENGFLLKGKGWRNFNLVVNISLANNKKLKKYHKVMLIK
ncbi:MAG TPA: tetratricopeptide repeat protein [Nitrososphaeraceae archaeon]|nr:tetratricopeptide repeat protein [Nitrososphaeraceae archaeon]